MIICPSGSLAIASAASGKLVAKRGFQLPDHPSICRGSNNNHHRRYNETGNERPGPKDKKTHDNGGEDAAHVPGKVFNTRPPAHFMSRGASLQNGG